MSEANKMRGDMQKILQRIEQRTGRQMRTPKDFQALSDDIFRQTHRTISPSTLKRLWGYFPSVRQPRQFTLDVLTQYVQATEQSILLMGQTFSSPDDYTSLFDILGNNDTPWSLALPQCLGTIIWSPEYQHPEWHNQGDAAHLMPTITEWWTPRGSRTDDTERNADNYLRATSFHELRITFMKNLTSEGYTFLGIYRLSHKSSPRRLVWQRVAERLDLRHLEDLEHLR